MPDVTDKRSLSGKERIARHRKRERERSLQVALAAARLVTGKEAGDAGRALGAFIAKEAAHKDIPDDYRETLAAAVDVLSSKRRR